VSIPWPGYSYNNCVEIIKHDDDKVDGVRLHFGIVATSRATVHPPTRYVSMENHGEKILTGENSLSTKVHW
jgi:hypothetical protein